MKATYRGHIISVTREKCMGGWSQIYYSVFRDGRECTTGFTSDASPVREFIGHMKDRVDEELKLEKPWGHATTEAGD